MNPGPLLIVEDGDDDFYAVQRALGKTLPCPLVRCSTGSEALDYVLRRGAYAQAQRPSLVLLDLNLPGTNGRTVLQQMKAEATLRAIPIVMLSTSNNPEDITDCYLLGCSGYIVKVMSYKEFAATLQTVSAYWFQTVCLPDAGEDA